jgi:membrane associated rhomboid family serine protease
VSQRREKIFNLPGVVTALIAFLALVQLATEVLPDSVVGEILEVFAFIPARVTYAVAPAAVLHSLETLAAGGANAEELSQLLGGSGHGWWTLLTYSFLHGNWSHLFINCLTLAAFGAPVARRFGSARFLGFLAATAIAGALTHLFVHPFDFSPVVGASAAVSGAMAAVARFAFSPGAPLAEERPTGRRDAEHESASQSASLGGLLKNRRALFFLAVWLGVNLLFGLFPQAAGAPGAIAWEAHMGGFIAGLLLFDFFDQGRWRASS